MKKLSLILVASLLTSQIAAAAQLTLVHAKSSPLKLARIERTNDLFAEFKGNIWVTGTLIAESHGEGNAGTEYLLVPDRDSRGRLPHFYRYGVQWINVINGQDAFQRAGGTTVAVRKTEDEVRFAKITGSFQISNYIVGVECDAPWARAVIVKVDIPDQRLVATLNSPDRC